MTLAALAALLTGDYNRRGQGRRVVAAIVVAVLIQTAGVSMQTVITKWPAATPLIYVNALLPIAILKGRMTHDAALERAAWEHISRCPVLDERAVARFMKRRLTEESFAFGRSK